jgi:hypothetical protein
VICGFWSGGLVASSMTIMQVSRAGGRENAVLSRE